MATIAEHEALSDDDPINKPAVYVDATGIAYYRMSALGMCDKALLALRQGYTPMAPPKKMQLRYDEGHLHEDSIMERAESEYGIPISGRQDELVLPIGSKVRLIGHIDGRGPWANGMAVVDGKTAADDAFKAWSRVQDGADLLRLFPYYWWQMGCYLNAPQHMSYEHGVFAVKCKNSGEMQLVALGRDQFPGLGAIAQRIMSIEARLYDDLPMECVKASFPCPVYYLHDEKPVQTIDPEAAEEIEALGVAFRAAKEALKLAEKHEKDAKAALIRRMGVKLVDDGEGGVKINMDPIETPGFKKITPYRGAAGGGTDWAKVLEAHPEFQAIIDQPEYQKDPTNYIAFRFTERKPGEGQQGKLV